MDDRPQGHGEVGRARDDLGRHPPSHGRRSGLELSDTHAPEGAPHARAMAYIRALPRSWKIAVVATSAVLVVACFARFGLSGKAVVGAGFVTVLVLLSAIDLNTRLIPNVIVLPATAVALVAQIALYPDHALEWVLASLGAALFLFLALLVVPGGMGMGDVKLGALMGAVLGTSVVAAILVGLVGGALYSIG